METEQEAWYRYEDVQYAAPCDQWGDPIPGAGELKVHLREYPVLRHTPKGVWLAGAGRWTYRDRFVLKDARKRFACPTIEEAKVSFIARKQRQAGIYHARAARAEQAINLLKFGRYDPPG